MLPLVDDASRPQEQGAGALCFVFILQWRGKRRPSAPRAGGGGLCSISVFERREGDASRPREQGAAVPPSGCYRLWMTRPGPESRGPGRFVSFLHCSGGGSDALPPREQGAEGFVPFLYLSGGSAARPDPGSRVAAVPLSGCYRLWMTRPGSGVGWRRCRPPDATA